jgi:hypothetical protein
LMFDKIIRKYYFIWQKHDFWDSYQKFYLFVKSCKIKLQLNRISQKYFPWLYEPGLENETFMHSRNISEMPQWIFYFWNSSIMWMHLFLKSRWRVILTHQ